MANPTRSYLKVPYDLRPAKQVERRMMFDALQILGRAGFDISEYQYTGFGSIFYVDFILFHRYLGLTRLVTVEHDDRIRDRIEFNKPFGLIEVLFKEAAEVIPALNPDLKHILWLDYDDFLRRESLQDLSSALISLSVGSIILATVDVEPPVSPGTPEEWSTFYHEEAAQYIPPKWTLQEFGRERLSETVRRLLSIAIKSALAYREGVKFSPLFSFLYADGHEMYTVGGMLTTAREEKLLRGSDLAGAVYARPSLDLDPYRIRVPNLTRKERLHVDANMPADPSWSPTEFKLDPEDIAAYREIYRFYPNYAELF